MTKHVGQRVESVQEGLPSAPMYLLGHRSTPVQVQVHRGWGRSGGASTCPSVPVGSCRSSTSTICRPEGHHPEGVRHATTSRGVNSSWKVGQVLFPTPSGFSCPGTPRRPRPTTYMLFPTAPLCSSLSLGPGSSVHLQHLLLTPQANSSPVSSDGAHKTDWAAFPGTDTTQEVTVRASAEVRSTPGTRPPDFQGIQGWVPQLHIHEEGRKGRVSGCYQIL